jgi:hypothetical protein
LTKIIFFLNKMQLRRRQQQQLRRIRQRFKERFEERDRTYVERYADRLRRRMFTQQGQLMQQVDEDPDPPPLIFKPGDPVWVYFTRDPEITLDDDVETFDNSWENGMILKGYVVNHRLGPSTIYERQLYDDIPGSGSLLFGPDNIREYFVLLDNGRVYLFKSMDLMYRNDNVFYS